MDRLYKNAKKDDLIAVFNLFEKNVLAQNLILWLKICLIPYVKN